MPLNTAQHGRRVYVPALDSVKRRRPPPAGVLVAILLALSAGCRTPPSGPVTVPRLLAVSYNVELSAAMGVPNPASVMAEDFAHIRKLGFSAVLARHSLDDNRAMVAKAARRDGLTLAQAPRDVLYYVRTGKLPQGCSEVTDLPDLGLSADRPGIVVIGTAVDASTADRARQVADAYGAQPDPPATLVVLAGPDVDASMVRPAATMTACSPRWAAEGSVGSVMLLDCRQREGETVPDAAARWMGEYHTGLAAGLTGGVIVEEFRVVPGHWRGLATATDRRGLERATILRRITGRSRRWGPRLRLVRPADIRPLGPVSDSLRVVLFTGAKRRYVMLFNTSTRHFARGIVDLPAEFGAQPVQRAVLVPADPHDVGGEVVRPRTGRLSLNMDLAPGDAALWELF